MGNEYLYFNANLYEQENNAKTYDIKFISQYLNNLGLSNAVNYMSKGATSSTYNFRLFENNYTPSFIKRCIDTLSTYLNTKIIILKNTEQESILSILISNKSRFYPKFFDYCGVLKNKPNGTMLFGLDNENNAIYYNIQDTKSLLVAGSSGSGKSVAMNNLIESIALFSDEKKVRINLIDLKKVEFSIYQNFVIVDKFASNFNGAVSILQSMIKEIQKRYSIMEQKGIRKATEDDFPIIITFIDEYAELSSINQKLVDGLVSRIAQIGRACNVYLVIATQTPTNKVISNLIRSNIQSRIGLRTTNIAQSNAILQSRDCVDLLGMGDAYLSIDGVNGLKRVQVFNITEKEILSHVKCIEPKKQSKWEVFKECIKILFGKN